MKKIVITLTFLILTYSLFQVVSSENETVCVELFYGSSCPHCTKEKEFLSGLEQKYPELKVNKYEVHSNETNAKLYAEVGKKYKISPELYNSRTVPVTFIDDKVFVGFDYGDTELYNQRYQAYIGYSGFMEKTIQECVGSGCACASEGCDPDSNTCSSPNNYFIVFLVGFVLVIAIFVLYKFRIKFKVKVKK